MALARDVSFTEYATNRTTRAAAAELSRLPDFRGPKTGGAVTPDTLFSGFTAGDLVGPYISQFLWKPAEFGGRVHNHLTGAASYPLHASVLNSQAVHEVFRRSGSYLLPQAFPEGSPLHPAYGAGHATVAGACVTILKAFFNESFIIREPVVPGPDGHTLRSYTGPGADRLTVGGELNKLAANVALGRNFAGIHWRTDYTESLKLGEAVAISVLRDQRACYNEQFGGFNFTKFDGTTITV